MGKSRAHWREGDDQPLDLHKKLDRNLVVRNRSTFSVRQRQERCLRVFQVVILGLVRIWPRGRGFGRENK